MKQLRYLLPLLLTLPVLVQAQTLEEWFRQRETQQKYLVQQIAAFKAYAGTLRQGYQVLQRGISTVQHIKNGDLGLHQAFFLSLGAVNPLIRQSSQVQDILDWQVTTVRLLTAVPSLLQQETGLTAAEKEYLEQVRAQVLAASGKDLETLWLLLTANALDLPDGERLERLAILHREMQARYRFTRSLLQEARLLALQRKHMLHDIAIIEFIYP